MPVSPIDVTPSAYTYPLLIKHLLHTPLARAPDREIVYRDLGRHSYRELRVRIGRLASGLARLGVRPGDTVAVMDWDSHRYLECFFAIPMMGAVLMTVNIRLSPDQILYTLNHAGADVLLVNSEFLPMLEAIQPSLKNVRRIVLITDAPEAPASALPVAAEYEALVASGSADFDFPDFDENTRATTFFTTGTTGNPKGVCYSHRQLVLHTLVGLAGLGTPARQGRFHQDDVYMPVAPMFHVHAWGVPYIATVMGVKQVYPGRYAPDTLLGLIKQHDVTFSHCVPTILHMLLTHPASKEVDLSRWKVIIGGAALPQGLARAALQRGIDVFTGYGMSETGPLLTLAQIDTAMLEAGIEEQAKARTRTGRPLPLVDLRVVDANMQELPHDARSAGEVVARAPWLTQGYLKSPDASEALWSGGYLHTGDIGHLDAQGYLQITDRMKDVIKTGGEWISSLALEDIISRHPAVSEVAVIGVADQRWGERPLALVVLKPGQAATIDAEAIRAHVAALADQGHIPVYAVPERILFIDAIDKTSVGKVNKKLLREKYRSA